VSEDPFLLAVDVGNTSTSGAVFRGMEMLKRERRDTSELRRRSDWVSWLSALRQEMTLPGRIIVATVVPELRASLFKASEGLFSASPHFLSHESPLGIEVAYRDPSQVGADRLANGVQAFESMGGPSVIVDFGTATTMDLISKEGRYEGGIIMPGIHMSLESLHANTALLPAVDFEVPEELLGRDTVASILAGAYYGVAAAIDGLLDRLADRLGEKPAVVATGGLAAVVKEESKWIDAVDQDLTLKGLCRVGLRVARGEENRRRERVGGGRDG